MGVILKNLIFLSILALPGKPIATTSDDTLKTYTYHLIDLANQAQDNPPKRFKLSSEALKYSKIVGDELLEGEALVAYGQALQQNNRFTDALDNAQCAANIFIHNYDSSNLVKAYNLMGVCYVRRAQYEKAIDYLGKTVLISRKIRDSLSLASGFNNLGIVYYNMERLQDAREYFSQSLEIYKKFNDNRNISRIEGNIGLICLKEGKNEEAISWFDSSLRIRQALKDTFMMASIYDNIGNVYEKMEDYQKSLGYYILSHQFFQKLKSRHGLALSNIAIARVQLSLGNVKDVFQYLSEGNKIAIEDNENELAMNSFRLLSDYYFKIGNISRSRQMLEEYIKYFEKSFNEKTTSRIAELQVQLETTRKEQENNILQGQLDMQEFQAKQSGRLITIYTVVAILLILMLGFTLYFTVKLRGKNKEIKRINRQLFLFNDELEQMVKDRTKDLTDALEKVKELEKIKSAFLANISHEIRTPLNGILGFTQYITSSDVSTEDKLQYGKMIQKLGTKLFGVVEDILELSKIETNQLDLHYSDSNINDLLNELYFAYSNNEDYIAKNLIFKVVKSLPDSHAIFSVDEYRLRKILSQLIENAFKFTHFGSIEFGYLCDSSTMLKFFVKDTGIGIPKNVQGRVFERFYRHIAEDNFVLYDGTGIGLTLAKGYAIAMGGRIEFESMLGQGSTFYLYLPKQAKGEIDKNNSVINFSNWGDRTIMVVEDDLISYQYVDALLSRTNARLIHVKNAEDAIEVCAINKNINLILLDIQLPFMNGIEAAKKIRQIDSTIPIIAQTANTVADEGENCINAGCNAFIAKPIDPDDLFNLIKTYIR